MARLEKSIEIKGPPEKVWPMVFWDRVPEWLDTVKKAECTSKEKDKIGATAHITIEVGGAKDEFDVETTEWKENEKFAWRCSHSASGFKATGSTTFSPIKGGIKATYIQDYNLPYSVLGKLIDKLRVSKEMAKSIERGLKKLKEIGEK